MSIDYAPTDDGNAPRIRMYYGGQAIEYVRADLYDEMLAACKLFVKYDSDSEGLTDLMNYAAADEAIRAAIAKAVPRPQTSGEQS